MKIGLFYGSSTCYTEMAAEKIRDILGEEFVDLHNVQECDITLMEQYDILILGIPTWDFGEIQEDWLNIWETLPTLNLKINLLPCMEWVTKSITANGFLMRWVCSIIIYYQVVLNLLVSGLSMDMNLSAPNLYQMMANILLVLH
ncbi:flavodoxin [Proteus penneri ATCC 35198]|nr:flavodoxin [Proteus penneri ATCC 35198]